MKRKFISAVIAVSMVCSSLLGTSAYTHGDISKNVPSVEQQEDWLCAPTSVGAALFFINNYYNPDYNADIESLVYQTSIAPSVGTGNPYNLSYGGDDLMMRNYLRTHQTERPSPYYYTIKTVAENSTTTYLNNVYNALNNNAPPLAHVKCNTSTFGYYTDGGHIMVCYGIYCPPGSVPIMITVMDPYKKIGDTDAPSLKYMVYASSLVDATRDVPNGVCNLIA